MFRKFCKKCYFSFEKVKPYKISFQFFAICPAVAKMVNKALRFATAEKIKPATSSIAEIAIEIRNLANPEQPILIFKPSVVRRSSDWYSKSTDPLMEGRVQDLSLDTLHQIFQRERF